MAPEHESKLREYGRLLRRHDRLTAQDRLDLETAIESLGVDKESDLAELARVRALEVNADVEGAKATAGQALKAMTSFDKAAALQAVEDKANRLTSEHQAAKSRAAKAVLAREKMLAAKKARPWLFE